MLSWSERVLTVVVVVLGGVFVATAIGEARQVTKAGGGEPPVTSTSSSTAVGFEAPPQCTTVGTARQVVTVTIQQQTGPACIGIGNRDIPNPSPACGGQPWGNPAPDFGETLIVPAGDHHVNKHTHTLTLTCVPPTPALPFPWLAGLGLGVLGTGAALLKRRAARH